jgi:hypothetical protein
MLGERGGVLVESGDVGIDMGGEDDGSSLSLVL